MGGPRALTPEQIVETGRFIAALQHDDGSLPWFRGDQWDAWNHTEALMGLTIAGCVSRETFGDDGGLLTAARRGLDHLRATQRPDGSWPMLVRDGVVVHDESDTNQCAYPAVGVWHLALACGAMTAGERNQPCPDDGPGAPDHAVVMTYWPMVRSAIEHVLRAQRVDGSLAWAINARGGIADEALLTGNASILQSLWAAAALADHVAALDVEHRDAARTCATRWRDAGARLAEAIRTCPEAFADRSRHSMDWFYPVLGGAFVGDAAHAHLDARWSRFAWPPHGVRCVDDHPWVTGGESAELVMALCCLDGTPHETAAREQARNIFATMQRTRAEGGGYWTGYVVDDDAIWPEEQTGWTAGAMLLAADALDGLTSASNLFHTMTWPPAVDAHRRPGP